MSSSRHFASTPPQQMTVDLATVESSGEALMPTFQLFIDDDRYSVPTLHLVNAETAAHAQAMAQKLWRESTHHRGVELRLDGQALFVGGTYAPGAERFGLS